MHIESEPEEDETQALFIQTPALSEIDSDDEFWKSLARPDNPIRQVRRKIKSLRKELEAKEKLYNKMIERFTQVMAPEDGVDSNVEENHK